MPLPSTNRGDKMKPEELREFMSIQGISKQELADTLGVSIQAVNFWLAGGRDISTVNTKLIRLFKKYPQLFREF